MATLQLCFFSMMDRSFSATYRRATYTHDVHTWHNVVLSNDFSQKLLLKVKADALMDRKLVKKNMT